MQWLKYQIWLFYEFLDYIWIDVVCWYKGHLFSPIDMNRPRSHCIRCGILNPNDMNNLEREKYEN